MMDQPFKGIGHLMNLFFESSTVKSDQYFLFMRKWFLNLQVAFSKSKERNVSACFCEKHLLIQNVVPEAASRFLSQLFFSEFGRFCVCFAVISRCFFTQEVSKNYQKPIPHVSTESTNLSLKTLKKFIS
jgi:hypothetical protein